MAVTKEASSNVDTLAGRVLTRRGEQSANALASDTFNYIHCEQRR